MPWENRCKIDKNGVIVYFCAKLETEVTDLGVQTLNTKKPQNDT